MCCTQLAENTGRKQSAKIRHLRTVAEIYRAVSSQLRPMSTIGKKTIKQQYLLHMFLQYYELRPTNGWDLLVSLWHPSKFQPVTRLASSLQRRRSPEANQTVHDVSPSPRYIIYTFSGALAPWQNVAGAKFTLRPKSCVLLYWQRYCAARTQLVSAKLCGVVQGMELRNFRRGRYLYSAGRPSRWASAHILVVINFLVSWHKVIDF